MIAFLFSDTTELKSKVILSGVLSSPNRWVMLTAEAYFTLDEFCESFLVAVLSSDSSSWLAAWP